MGGDPLTTPTLAAPPRSRQHRFGRTALVFAPLAAVALVGAVNLLASLSTPFAAGGDDAVTELMTRGASAFELTYGPYSRFGWRHPGPLFFYVLAPFYSALGTRGMFLAVWAVNAAAALCTVWAVRRRASDLAAIWTGAVVCVLLVVYVPAKELWLAWNPAVLTVPLVLAAVLAAATWAGSRLSFAGTVLVASFLVQAHIGTAPVVVLTVVVASAGLLRDVVRTRRSDTDADDSASDGAAPERPGGRRTTRVIWACAVVAFVLIWSAPLADAVVSGGGNLADVAEFFVRGDGDAARSSAGAAQSFTATTRRIAVFPLGSDPWPHPTLDDAPLSLSRVIASALLLALACVVAVRSRRRAPFASALAVWSVAAFAVAFVSVTGISDGVQAYLLWWLAAVPVPGVIAAGVLAVVAIRSRRGDMVDDSRVRRVAAAICAVPAVVLVVAILHAPNDPGAQWPDGPAAAELLLGDPATSTGRGVLVTPTQDSWPENAALAAALARRGVHVTVSDDWRFMFGNMFRRTGDESVSATVLPVGADASTAAKLLGPDVRDLGPVGEDGERLWVAP